ncbi:type 2 isopentenyl-diphosphate Delta-isomerase [Bacillus canaveralius]|uniref:type 2 isopentenyl-diphosphate Delta-isomerase n=1 Tax=Bacillus canaveralius TaxID=1403243 RepID=UPI000F7AC0AE|nr:type 2 isopentenyl-diphosphate Delta-isomerase [Bacillus canaveralius]RSK51991.1 type 2 isopentenyl-diphosphate Delta-isomerase [Bacillus canaveralius]
MSRSKRKWDHVQFALKTGQERSNGFDDIQFVHQNLPSASVNNIGLNTQIGELSLSSPIFINAMTGGGGEKTLEINRKLAIAAKRSGIAISMGSQMSALKDQTERKTYEIIRKENPDGIVFGNIGSEATVEQAQAAVEMVAANALQIHLNVIQELTMPEGDHDFRGALRRIEKIIQQLQVPVIVKEVGFGMSGEAVAQLASIGVAAVDVSGFGGTNFAKIENERRERLLSFFNSWGVPTAVSIVEAKHAAVSVPIIGSGGIQNSLDVAKAIALGADAVGMAGFLLKILFENGLEALIDEIAIIHHELTLMMTALGAININALQKAPLIISGNTFHWLNERGIDTKKYSQRTLM